MKKILLTVCIFALMCCDIKVEPRGVKADELIHLTKWTSIKYDQRTIEGMEYGIFYSMHNGYESGNGVSVVNLTKEKLEVEKLQLEINKLAGFARYEIEFKKADTVVKTMHKP